MGDAVKFFTRFADRFWIPNGIAPSGISSEIGMIWEGTDNQTFVKGQEAVLAVFSGGRTKSGGLVTEAKFKEVLRAFYPGYDRSNQGKTPHLQAWPNENFIKTGYSCPKPGDIFKRGRRLQDPLAGGRLIIAGEHTQTEFFGFMEGALRSGRRAALGLIDDVCGRIV
jgi:monoamine oxidase